MAAQSLTPPLRTTTTVPFPKQHLSSTNDSAVTTTTPAWEADGTQTISVDACSELTQHQFQLDLFSVRDKSEGRNDKLTIVNDSKGQPLVFSIGSDHHLYMLAYVSGGNDGWQKLDLTPQAAEEYILDHIDVIRTTDKIYIAAAVSDAKIAQESDYPSIKRQHDVWLATFSIPTLSMVDNKLSGLVSSDLSWQKLANNLGKKRVTTLSCIIGPSIEGSVSGLWIAVGGTGIDGGSACFIIDPTNSANPWEVVETVVPAEQLSSIQAAVRGSAYDQATKQPAIASLVKRSTSGKGGVYIDSFSGPERNRTSVALLTEELGTVNGFCASMSVYGMTDILAAGDRGLGFFAFEKAEKLDQLLLPGVAIRQVTCTEVLNSGQVDGPDILSRLSVLAVSDQDELYFIQGYRNDDNKVIFDVASGLPIRTDVKRMSVQYNYDYRSTEILYVCRGQANRLSHLIRDPVTSLWSDTSIAVQPQPDERAAMIARDVYSTVITLSNGSGVKVPDGYTISITGTRMAISVNSVSMMLSDRPLKLSTSGGTGQFLIVAPSDGLYGAPEYNVTLAVLAAQPTVVAVQASQRVHRLMSSVKSVEDLENLKTSDGACVFAGYDKQQLEDATELIKGASYFGPDGQLTKNVEEDAAKNTEEHTAKADKSNWERLIDGDLKAIGDIFEAIRNGFKEIFRPIVRLVDKIWLFIVKIGTKMFKFVMKGVGLLLKGISAGLKWLGVDTSTLDRWLKFIFDNTGTIETQAVLKDYFTGASSLCIRFLEVNRESVKDIFAELRKTLEAVLKDPRPPHQEKHGGSQDKIMALFDNPVVQTLLRFNPISLLLEVIGEEMEAAGVKIPRFSKLTDCMARMSLQGLDIVIDIVGDIASSLASAGERIIADPDQFLQVLIDAISGQIWTIFDAVESSASLLYDLLIDVVKIVLELLTEEWEIPGVTDIWEEMAEQKFSLLGFVTYQFAALLNFGSMFTRNRFAFEDAETFDAWDSISAPRLYTSGGQTALTTVIERLGVATFKLEGVQECINAMENAKHPATFSALGVQALDYDDKHPSSKSKPGLSSSGKAKHIAEVLVSSVGEVCTMLSLWQDLAYNKRQFHHQPTNPGSLENILSKTSFALGIASFVLKVGSTIVYLNIHYKETNSFPTFSFFGLLASAGIWSVGTYLRLGRHGRDNALVERAKVFGTALGVVSDFVNNLTEVVGEHPDYKHDSSERAMTWARMGCEAVEVAMVIWCVPGSNPLAAKIAAGAELAHLGLVIAESVIVFDD